MSEDIYNEESGEKYRTIFENINDAIVMLDTRGNILDVNKKVEDVIGYKIDEVKGKNLLKIGIFHPRDLPRITKIFSVSVKERAVLTAGKGDGTKNVMELPIRDKEGKTHFVEASTTAIKKNGRIDGFLSMIRDVTESKRIENELRLLREINNAMNQGTPMDDVLKIAADGMKEVFEFGSCGIYLLDEEREALIFHTVSFESKILKKIEELTGFSLNRMRIPLYEGSGFTDVIKKKKSYTSTDIKKIFRDFTDNEKLWPLAGQFQRLTGFKSVVRTPLVAEGEPIGLISASIKEEGVEIDVERIERFASHLALIVKKGRAEEELKRAYNELKSLDELKANVISNVSHELRTPITIVKGTLEILLEGGDPKMNKKLISTARQAIKRQDMLVQDLIEAAKLQHGSKSRKLELSEVDLEKVISLSVLESKGMAFDKGIKLIKKVDRGLPHIVGDYKKIQHALKNLLNNAFKFTNEGSVTIWAKHKKEEVEICVEDTGIGIPKEYHKDIFRTLYQVDSSVTRRYSGAGMGLPIVKNIVEDHGGRIWVESNPGKGSKFYFTLPVDKEG